MRRNKLMSFQAMLVLVMVLAPVLSAGAVSYTLPSGTSVDTSNGGVEVNVGGNKINATSDQTNTSQSGSVSLPGNRNIDLNRSINPDGTVNKNVNVTTGTSATNSQINVSVDGRQATIDRSAGSLNVQVSSNALSADSQKAVVSLQGGTVTLIANDSDLTAYNNLVIKTRPSVKGIEVAGNEVKVQYRQKAKFLGLFNASLNSRVEVRNNEVKIKFPWYRFLYSVKTDEVKSLISLNINQGSSENLISVQKNAVVINAVTAGVSGIDITATETSSTSTSGACSVPENFPFEKYSLTSDLPRASVNGTVIAQGVNAQDNSKTNLMITRALDAGNGTVITQAYVFDTVDLPQAGSIVTLNAATNAALELDGSVGKLNRMSKSDLVRKAMVAVNLLGSACNY